MRVPFTRISRYANARISVHSKSGNSSRNSQSSRSKSRFAVAGLGIGAFVLTVTDSLCDAKSTKLTCFHVFLNNGLAIDKTSILSWGLGVNCQLGHGDKKSESVPRVLESMPRDDNAVKISTRKNILAVVMASGDVYTWGQGQDGALGHNDEVRLNTNAKYVGCKDSTPPTHIPA